MSDDFAINAELNAELQKAIADVIRKELQTEDDPNSRRLYMTKAQYELDPDGWRTILRDAGLPEENIVVVPPTIEEV